MKDSFGRWPTWRENVAIGLGAVLFPPWNVRATLIGFLGTWMIVAGVRQGFHALWAWKCSRRGR